MITIYGTGNPDMQSSAVVMVCLCIKKQIMRERKICAQLKIKNKKAQPTCFLDVGLNVYFQTTALLQEIIYTVFV